MKTISMIMITLIATTTMSAQTDISDTTMVKIGYTKGDQNTIAGAVNQVTKEHMNKGLITSSLDYLNGQAAGVQVMNSGNQEAMVSAVRVRGTTSLAGNNDPLVIIDGVAADLATLYTIYPADIESLISEALSNKETSVDLSGYVFEPEALIGNLPDGSNLLVTVSPDSGITGTNIINNGVCENLVLTDGADFSTPYKFTATQASYMTQVNTYKTLILPFEATVPVEFTASKATSVEGTTVKLESVASISANKPVLVSGNGMLVLTATDVAVTSEGKLANGVLRGVYQSAPATEGSYVLQNQNGVTGFYHVGDVHPTIGAFRAYLNVPVSGVKAYFFEEDATGVKGLNDLKDSNVVIFNLAGQRMSKMQKGVNIVNGKKTLK